jgi:hypothetical protein
MKVCLEVLLEFVFFLKTSKFWNRGPYRDLTGVALIDVPRGMLPVFVSEQGNTCE